MQNYNTTQARWSAWDYRDTGWAGRDIAGYEIEALDGSIGKVDEATWEVGSSYMIVDTGPWIFGQKVMLPAGVVSGVDHENERVFVERTKEQIKNAPDFDESRLAETTYRDELRTYYGEDGGGWYDRANPPDY